MMGISLGWLEPGGLDQDTFEELVDRIAGAVRRSRATGPEAVRVAAEAEKRYRSEIVRAEGGKS